MSIILYHLENRLYITNFLIKGFDRLSMKTFDVKQVTLKWGQVV